MFLKPNLEIQYSKYSIIIILRILFESISKCRKNIASEPLQLKNVQSISMDQVISNLV